MITAVKLITQILRVGDLVQAKWEDGRMYFGKVLKVCKGALSIPNVFNISVHVLKGNDRHILVPSN